MGHDLVKVDLIRERMGVGYEAALAALDASEGDVVRALATVERQQRSSLEDLTQQIREGVTRGLKGERIGTLRWSVQDQVVGEAPVNLAGFAAVLTGVLSVLISSSAIELTYVPGSGESQPNDRLHQSLAEVSNG